MECGVWSVECGVWSVVSSSPARGSSWLEAAHFSWEKSDYLGCAMLLCMPCCLFDLAHFFLPISIKFV